jgi:hypothetical protein
MDLVFDTMAAIDVQEPRDELTYHAAEKQFGVNKDTFRAADTRAFKDT